MMNIIINSSRDLHEKLTCHSYFQNECALMRIQNYLAYYITYYKLINALPEEENYGSFELRITLSAEGKTITEQNLDDLLKAIADLGEYDGFELEVRYNGRTGDVYCDFGAVEMDFPDVLNNYDGMLEYLQEIVEPDFEYVMAASCDVDGSARMYWIDDSSNSGESIINRYIADSNDDWDMGETGEFYLLMHFDFEKNHRQYERIMDIVVEYDSIEEEIEFTREIWEEGEQVGFCNIAAGWHNIGELARMLEKINNELKSVEGDVEFSIEGALYDVDDFKYAYLSVDENNMVSLVVLS